MYNDNVKGFLVLESCSLTYTNKMATRQRFRPARPAPAFSKRTVGARTVGTANSSATFGRQCTVRGKGSEGADDAEGWGGTMVCTAAGRWVRSVSTVRELDRASGPLVGPVPTRLCTYTGTYAKRAAASVHPCTDTSLECTLCARACTCSTRALARALREYACASDTLPVSQCVRQERCIALRRCVKASENTRSLGLFARLVPSFSRRRALRGPLSSPVEPLRHGSRSLFSISVTPPKGPLPRASVPRSSRRRGTALRLHRRYREREDFGEECREPLTRVVTKTMLNCARCYFLPYKVKKYDIL